MEQKKEEQMMDLVKEKEKLCVDIGSIKAQIEYCEIEEAEGGAKFDRTWRAQARYAIHKKAARLQTVQAKIGEANRNSKQFKSIFLQVAKEALEPEVFEELESTAKAIQEKQ